MWLYQGQELTDIPDKSIGFVYLIVNTINDRKYIGKKLFHSSKTKQVNLKKKKVKVESDWRKYFGSNDELLSDVKFHGKDNFTREILHICYGKGECNYLELREQIDRRVLESDEYYNHWFTARVTQAHIKRLQKVVA